MIRLIQILKKDMKNLSRESIGGPINDVMDYMDYDDLTWICQAFLQHKYKNLEYIFVPDEKNEHIPEFIIDFPIGSFKGLVIYVMIGADKKNRLSKTLGEEYRKKNYSVAFCNTSLSFQKAVNFYMNLKKK